MEPAVDMFTFQVQLGSIAGLSIPGSVLVVPVVKTGLPMPTSNDNGVFMGQGLQGLASRCFFP